MKKQIALIYRAHRFSPNSVEKDRAILDAVAGLLETENDIHRFSEDEWDERKFSVIPKDLVLSMARTPDVLMALDSEALFTPIVNRPDGVKNCSRLHVHQTMARLGIPLPPSEGGDGYWLKRADVAAQDADDVRFVPNKDQLAEAIHDLEGRHVRDYIVSAHVKGDLIKFYGVRQTSFFHYCYPVDTGQSKFGHETRNGVPHHYPFPVSQLLSDVDRLASELHVDVYGGDCIVRADGSYCLIDFNDWPSFSTCREEAASAIVELVKQQWT